LSFFTILFSLSNSFFTISLFSFLSGLSGGAIFPSSIKLVYIMSKDSQMTSMIGLMETAAPLSLLLTTILTPLIFNWHLFYFSLGLTISLLPVSCFIMKEDYKKKGSLNVRGIFNKDLSLLVLARFGGQWGTYGTSTWFFSVLVLYANISTPILF